MSILPVAVVAEERQAKQRVVHVVLLTDGFDNHGLVREFRTYKQSHASVLYELAQRKFLTLHCVGICSNADAKMLSDLSEIAYTGTFQMIDDAGITGLVGSLWALVSELVGMNGVARISVDGTQIMFRKFPLRVCHPPVPMRVSFDVPEGAMELSAEITVLDEVRTVRIWLPREDPNHLDPQCAIDAVASIQSEAATSVAGLVRERNFDAALRVNDDTIERIEALAVRNAPELATVIREALGILAEQADAIEASKSSADAAHELELRNLSRAVTERSTSMSIDPSSQSTTMSQMQREMSGVF